LVESQALWREQVSKENAIRAMAISTRRRRRESGPAGMRIQAAKKMENERRVRRGEDSGAGEGREVVWRQEEGRDMTRKMGRGIKD
jgi:hypothetical protein